MLGHEHAVATTTAIWPQPSAIWMPKTIIGIMYVPRTAIPSKELAERVIRSVGETSAKLRTKNAASGSAPASASSHRPVQSTCCYYVVGCPNVNCVRTHGARISVDPGARRHHDCLTYLTSDVVTKSLLCVLVNSKV